MKIGILGTRGIPNNYGGYEQITGYLAAGLAAKGHDITVYNSHNHPNQLTTWNGVNIQHCYDPECFLGTAGQFIYDFNCIRHARKNNFDVWLFMGYTSSSVWRMFFPKNTIIISNMDGVEWKRAKYSKPVQQFLKYAERWAVRHSQFHIADSSAIKEYLDKAYEINCRFIPYGASVLYQQKEDVFQKYGIRKKEYHLLIARIEPENNLEMILDGYQASNEKNKFLVIGKTDNKFGKYIVDKYKSNTRIEFLGGVFDQEIVHSLRTNSQLYFHGHSVGGTNPSLLEAMASSTLIAAHDNVFNRSVLGEDAFYFSNSSEVKCLLENNSLRKLKADFTNKNLEKIKLYYSWDLIINSYEEFICHCYQSKKIEKYFKPKGYAYK